MSLHSGAKMVPGQGAGTPITHTEAVEPSADPSRWRCGRAGFQTGGVENQILGLAVWKLQKSVGGVQAANWRCRNFNPERHTVCRRL